MERKSRARSTLARYVCFVTALSVMDEMRYPGIMRNSWVFFDLMIVTCVYDCESKRCYENEL
jgi:hypothetical protein